MRGHTVKQVARVPGVSVRTLHHYDEVGLLKPASVGENGYRYYGREELLRLQQILFHRELGFSLEEIGRLLDGGRPWHALARQKVEELQGRIAELEQTTALLRSAMDCGCRSLETCGRTAHLATLAGPVGPSVRTGIGAAPERA